MSANWFANPGFEEGTRHWVLGGRAALVTTEGYQSSQSMKLRSFFSSVGPIDDDSTIVQGKIQVVIGRTYTISGFANGDDQVAGPSTNLRILIDTDDDGVAEINTEIAGSATLAGWLPFTTTTFTPTAGQITITFRCTNITPPPEGDVFWLIDALRMEADELALAPVAGVATPMPQNTPGPQVFSIGYIDAFHATLHKGRDMTRDIDGQLRRSDDVDEPNRSHLIERWGPSNPVRDNEP